MQAHPESTILHEDAFDFHRKPRADARERMDHEADQRAIAQTGIRANVVEQAPSFIRRQNRRLAFFYHVTRAAHGRGRIDRHSRRQADGGSPPGGL